MDTTNAADKEFMNKRNAMIERFAYTRTQAFKDEYKEDVELLLQHATGDTGGGVKCRKFLLAVHNDENRFDILDLNSLDSDLFDAAIRIVKNTSSLYWVSLFDDGHKIVENLMRKEGLL